MGGKVLWDRVGEEGEGYREVIVRGVGEEGEGVMW